MLFKSVRRLFLSLPLIVSVGAGCGDPASSVSSTGGLANGGKSGTDTPVIGEVMSPLVVTSQSLVATTQAISTANKVLNLSAIQPNGTVDDALAVITKAVLALGSCTNVDLDSLALDFGNGCTLTDSGLTLKGKLGANLGLANGQIQVTVTFTNFEVAGTGVKELPALPIDGSVILAIKGLDKYGVTLDLDSKGILIAGDLDLGIDLQPGVSISGPLNINAGPLFLTVTLNGVGFALTSCYPGAGTIVIGETLVETMTFTADTARTGTFGLTGPLSGSLTLPGYADCPN